MDYAEICRKEIGVSGTFCVMGGCSINHPGKTASVKPGDIYVAKVKRRTGFLKPILADEKVGESLLSEMLMHPLTFNEWNTKFDQINACYDEIHAETGKYIPVSLKDWQEFKEEELKSLNFKTPKRDGKRNVHVADLGEKKPNYKRPCMESKENFAKMGQESKLDSLFDVLQAIDEGLTAVQKFIDTLFEKHVLVSNHSSTVANRLQGKIRVVEREVEKKGEELKKSVEAPTL